LLGYYVRLTQLDSLMDGSTNREHLQFYGDSGATRHLSFHVTAGGVLRVRRSDGNDPILASSAANIIKAATWQYWEIWATCNDSTGRVVVQIDGSTVIDFTGDTKNGGTNNSFDMIRWGRSAPANIGEIRVSDSSTFLGPTTVYYRGVNGNGASTGLTGSDGNQTDNYLLVDETTPNGDTDYVEGTTVGTGDTYAVADTPTGSWDVYGARVVWNSRTTDAGAKATRGLIRTGGTIYPGADWPNASSYDAYWEVWEDNPDTASAWTAGEIDAVEVGVQIADDPT
jgi:hypothetical protein